MNDFRELQSIYEYYRGELTDRPLQSYGAIQGSPSYRKGEVPTATPGAYNMIVSHIEDEEDEVIPKDVLISKIQEIISASDGKSNSEIYDILKFIKDYK